MSVGASRQLAPGGSAIAWRTLTEVVRLASPERALDERLRARFPGCTPTYHASGREAMRFAFAELAARTGRREVALPAYCCYSIPASAAAAGLRIHLIDVDERGRLAPEALASIAWPRLAAVVVANLFGMPEPVAPLRAKAEGEGCRVVDDAAQAIGAIAAEGVVGGRGDLGVLSFGRGKPISALGGGALLWSTDAPPDAPALPRATASARAGALGRALAYDLARQPVVLHALARIPALEIGQTIYDPDFRRGALPSASLPLAAALLADLDERTAAHRRRAEALAAEVAGSTAFEPILAADGERAGYARLALRAPDSASRDRALAELAGLGATRMYPESLDRLAALTGLRADDGGTRPGARDFAARLLTLPTHAGLRPAAVATVVEGLKRAGRSVR